MNAARTLSEELRPDIGKKSRISLPDYTRGEEIVNTVTHIVGGALAIAAIPLLVVFAALHRDPWAIVSGAVYGVTLVIMFTISSVYHGLRPGRAKRVMRVIDHCDIYLLIAGTYTPILLCSVRPVSPEIAWTIFGVEWGLAAIAVVLNAVDLKRFEKLSMACYIGMGWCVVAVMGVVIRSMSLTGFLLLLFGGVFFTIGAILYGVGKKVRYMHSVFHILVVVGCVLDFFAILFYVI